MLQILLASPYHCHYVGHSVALNNTLFDKVHLNTVYLDIVFLNTIFLNTVFSLWGPSVLCWVQEERGGATRHLQLGACKEEHAETRPRSPTKRELTCFYSTHYIHLCIVKMKIDSLNLSAFAEPWYKVSVWIGPIFGQLKWGVFSYWASTCTFFTFKLVCDIYKVWALEIIHDRYFNNTDKIKKKPIENGWLCPFHRALP